jgi:branched-chain amino acid transport system permease protein
VVGRYKMAFDKLGKFHLEIDDKILLVITGGAVIFEIAQPIFNIPNYYLFVLSNIFTFGILALAYNLLHGHTGLLSFGHAGFFLVGAYTGALTMQFTGNNVYFGFIFCFLASAIFAFIVGYIAVRLKGIYFAILTLAFSMLPFFLIRDTFSKQTRGTMGWHLLAPPPFFFDLLNPALLLLFALGVFIATYIILRTIINSNFGQCLKCIQNNELKMEALGYNTRQLKYIAVTISGSFAGLAGFFWLLINRSISPEIGSYFMSAKIIFVALIGGVSSIIGPILGVFIWFTIEEFLLIPGFFEITLGLALIVVILRWPSGIMGLFIK